jgi:membrane-associated phospholipid phosphatase
MRISRNNLDIADLSTLSYNSIVVCIILISYQRIEHWYIQIASNLGFITLILFVFASINRYSAKTLRFLHSFYPIFLFTLLYEQTEKINVGLFQGNVDHLLQRIDLAIFGFQPSIRFSQVLSYPWLPEYMHFAYFSYYLLIPGLGLLLYLRADRQLFKNYMFAVCNTFYTCYLLFMFLPAAGPGSVAVPVFKNGNLFIPLVHMILSRYDIHGGAMPSSHVAVAVVILYYAYHHSRLTFGVCAPLCVSLIFATVYCGYHYAIDAIAGVIVAAIILTLSRRIASRLATIRPEPATTLSDYVV